MYQTFKSIMIFKMRRDTSPVALTKLEISPSTYDDLRNILLPRLLGRVFHLTSAVNLKAIQNSGFILNNQFGRFSFNPTSEPSFGRKKGWVCFFDLRDRLEPDVSNTLFKYDFLRPDWLIRYTKEWSTSDVAYFFLSPTACDKLINVEFAKKESPNGHYIPEAEVWYPGDVPISMVQDVLQVEIRMAAPKEDSLAYALLSGRRTDKRKNGGHA